MTQRSHLRNRSLSITLAAWLLWLHPHLLRADNSISYKYEDYRETGGRISVKTHGLYVSQNLGTDMVVTAEGVIDSISGATPNGEPAPAGSDQVPLTEMHDRRKAWNTTLSRQFERIDVSLGYAHSLESDYLSNGASLNTVTNFNEKNTTLLLGVAGTDDRVRVFFQPQWLAKRSYSAIVGLGQVINPDTTVSLNVSIDRSRGYLSDPYKVVAKTVQVLPGISLPETFAEDRPPHRQKVVVYATLDHAFPKLHAAVQASYRYYHDSFGVAANTGQIKWLQKIDQHLLLEPEARLYLQGAADFYHYDLNQTNITPVNGAPPRQGPYYSSDHRLSRMRTTSLGMTVEWTLWSSLKLNVSYERYDMHGLDGITPQSAYAHANIVNGGIDYVW